MIPIESEPRYQFKRCATREVSFEELKLNYARKLLKDVMNDKAKLPGTFFLQ